MKFHRILSAGSLSASLALIAACSSGSSSTPPGTDVPPSYTLGGTVSQLTTAGLVLANGTDRASISAGSTTFSMPEKLSAGTTFKVTVATQPTGQTCSVANGAGTMTAADYANVVVSCADSAFKVGGSISGLTAPGLVLANGGETISVAASSTRFQLDTAVASGASYDVTVQSQPAGLVCAVSNGQGQVASSDVSNVDVACQPATPATRTIGGSVSGLTSGGLVLANGADSVSVASGATSFTMNSPVTQGASYAVGVATQPAGLTCSATHASGVAGSTDVTNVAIVCAANTYTLGGTITGLDATGLILSNGSDTLVVAANAALFTMPTPLTAGAAYLVGVQARPGFKQCAATNASGTMPAANVTDVALSCSWGGTVTTIAGTAGVTGSTDATGAAASFNHPFGIARNSQGDLFIGDLNNNLIRRVTSAGVVTTFAGTTTHGTADGNGAAAGFFAPSGIAIDAADNLYVVDRFNYLIRKITPAGDVTTLAGSGGPGFANGTGAAASFSAAYGLAVDSQGIVYVADMYNNQIRKITPAGVVTTFAGSSTSGSADGNGSSASFNSPAGIAVDRDDNVYVSEVGGHRIRKITPSGDVTTIAGAGTSGNTDGTGSAAKFNQPYGLAVDADGVIYVADTLGNKIRRVTQSGVVTTIVGVPGLATAGHADGVGAAATVAVPTTLTFDANGDLYVADYNNHTIRKVQR